MLASYTIPLQLTVDHKWTDSTAYNAVSKSLHMGVANYAHAC